jgi:hypothetical protein
MSYLPYDLKLRELFEVGDVVILGKGLLLIVDCFYDPLTTGQFCVVDSTDGRRGDVWPPAQSEYRTIAQEIFLQVETELDRVSALGVR